MRSLLGGMAGGAEPLEEAREASPPSSPGARRRGLADFLRGIGGGRARIGAMFFDDEFPHFFGRDSAALDPRNYLVRAFSLLTTPCELIMGQAGRRRFRHVVRIAPPPFRAPRRRQAQGSRAGQDLRAPEVSLQGLAFPTAEGGDSDGGRDDECGEDGGGVADACEEGDGEGGEVCGVSDGEFDSLLCVPWMELIWRGRTTRRTTWYCSGLVFTASTRSAFRFVLFTLFLCFR